MLKEIIDNEINRDEESLDKIYLWKDGNGPWYKAYEWSAYLLEFYPQGPEEKLKATKKPYNGAISSFVSVSLQLSSLDKFAPGKIIISQDDKKVVISADVRKYDEFYPGIKYTEVLENWKNTLKLKEKITEDTNRPQKNIFGNQVTFFTVLKTVLTYDMYGKSEGDLREFVQELKNKCADLIF